jgi:hypothetical protein
LRSTLRVKSASLVLALPEARLPALEISSNDTRISGLNRVVIFVPLCGALMKASVECAALRMNHHAHCSQTCGLKDIYALKFPWTMRFPPKRWGITPMKKTGHPNSSTGRSKRLSMMVAKTSWSVLFGC